MRRPRAPGLRLALPLVLALALAPHAHAPEADGDRAWRKGDWHVHTWRGDAEAGTDICGSLLDPWRCTGDPSRLGFTPEEMVQLAKLRGLDYLAITDHNRGPWQPPPDAGIVVLPGFEGTAAPLGRSGHLGITGVARHVPPAAPGATPDERLRAYFGAIHAAGGLVAINHPRASEAGGSPFGYGDAVAHEADAVEVWNAMWWARSAYVPFLGNENHRGVAWWESLLDQGARLPALGGSDTHHYYGHAVQGVGQPATWVHAALSVHGVLDGVRAGRTFVTWDFTGPQLHLEGDAACDGAFEALPGDTVPPGACLRVRTPVPEGLVRVRAGGPGGAGTLLLEPASPLGVSFRAPEGRTWVRADLLLVEHDELVVRALTSAVYVG